MVKKISFLIGITMCIFLFYSCPPPEENGEGTITGIVRDSYTGAPVGGMHITCGSKSALTGSDGRYTVSLGQSSGMVNDYICMYKTGYFFLQIDGVEADAGKENTVNMFTNRIYMNEYDWITVSGSIYSNPGSPTEIDAGSSVTLYFFNSNTGTYIINTSYSAGYSIDTPTFGSDCLVIASVTGAVNMAAMLVGVDLSGNTTLDITETYAVPTPVSITGEQAGDEVTLRLSTPYGFVPAGTHTLSGSSPQDMYYLNPGGYTQCVWQVVRTYIETGYTKKHQVSSNIVTINTPVTLPDIDETLGPNGPIDINSFDYQDGTFSLDPVTDASLYQHIILNPANSLPLGFFMTPQKDITLAEPLAYKLSGNSYAVMANAVDLSNYTSILTQILSTTGFRAGDLPAGIEIGIVDRDDGNQPFYNTIAF
jgi:hypothetical protein